MSKSRREFLKAAGIAVVTPHAVSAVAQENHAVPSGAESTAEHVSSAPHAKPDYSFFNPAEARFIEAATARLIPADEAGPGAIEAGVPGYIDKQLGGAWGAGERLYRSGPWHEGEPTQGYQLPFTPSELFRTALRGIQADLDSQQKGAFESLAEAQQDDYLKRLQNEKIDLEGVPSNVFFESLWAMTVEGFLGDPVYGGNVDMISWKMIGFPGAHASFYDLVDQYNLKYEREPVSIGEDARGRMHIHPNIRATVDARPSPILRDAPGATRHG